MSVATSTCVAQDASTTLCSVQTYESQTTAIAYGFASLIFFMVIIMTFKFIQKK